MILSVFEFANERALVNLSRTQYLNLSRIFKREFPQSRSHIQALGSIHASHFASSALDLYQIPGSDLAVTYCVGGAG